MKKIFIAIMVAIIATSCASQREVTNIADIDGVKTTYINGGAVSSALKSIHSSLDISDKINVKSVEVITCDKRSSIKQVRKILDRRLSAMGDGEPIFQTTGKDDGTYIFGKEDPLNPDRYSQVVVYNYTRDNLQYVVLTGAINKQEVRRGW